MLPLTDDVYRQASACVHCGLCLPACPTYNETGLEADSPRGRIYLMKAMADGRMTPSDNVRQHLDQCLDCRACEPACPSGVVYHRLIEQARTIQAERQPKHGSPIVRALTRRVFTRPSLLKVALLPARFAQKLGLWGLTKALSGKPLGRLTRLLPASGAVWERSLAARYPAEGERRMTVGLHAGCVQSVLGQSVNRKAVALLRRFGCEVVVPRAQRCCGAIHHHDGDTETACGLAQHNIDAFADCDRIVTVAAGCGAMLKQYDELISGAFGRQVRDISELLTELDPPAPTHRVEQTVAYHHACHLAHAQGVADPPMRLLATVEGLTVVPLTEADLCCGAAGTYNLSQPDMADRLADRKLKHLQNSGASVCVTGNIGCALQIAAEAHERGLALDVVHTVDVLHEAYLGRSPG